MSTITTKQSLSEPLIRRYQAGDSKAGGELLALHAGLLRKFAKRWGRSLDRDDALQEARMGLLKAAKEYDFNNGAKFATLAGWWVRDHVLSYQRRTCRNVRLPKSVYERAAECRKTGEELPVGVKAAFRAEARVDAPKEFWEAPDEGPSKLHLDAMGADWPLPDAGVDAWTALNLLEKSKELLTLGRSESHRPLLLW